MGSQSCGDRKNFHCRTRFKPIVNSPVAPRLKGAFSIVVGVITRVRCKSEDLACCRVDNNKATASCLVGAHRSVELLLGDILNALIKGEEHRMASESLLVLYALSKEQPAAPVA